MEITIPTSNGCSETCNSACQVHGTRMPTLTETLILYLLCLPQILLQETFLMECLSSDYLQPFLPVTLLAAQLPRAAFFSTSNRYLGLWILPPKYLIPFSSTTQLPSHQVTTNSLLRCSSSLLTGSLVSSLCFSSIPLAVRMRLLKHRFHLVTNFLFNFLQQLSIVQRTKSKFNFANMA